MVSDRKAGQTVQNMRANMIKEGSMGEANLFSPRRATTRANSTKTKYVGSGNTTGLMASNTLGSGSKIKCTV